VLQLWRSVLVFGMHPTRIMAQLSAMSTEVPYFSSVPSSEYYDNRTSKEATSVFLQTLHNLHVIHNHRKHSTLYNILSWRSVVTKRITSQSLPLGTLYVLYVSPFAFLVPCSLNNAVKQHWFRSVTVINKGASTKLLSMSTTTDDLGSTVQ